MAEQPQKKVNRSTMLPVDLVARARNAVFWTRMLPEEPSSYSQLTERALLREVRRLERKYNEGEPFSDGELRPGPAPGVMQRVAQMRKTQAESDDGDDDDEEDDELE